jgi:hypothetical protein
MVGIFLTISQLLFSGGKNTDHKLEKLSVFQLCRKG